LQVIAQPGVLANALIQVAGVPLKIVAPLLFGFVHGHVSLLDQLHRLLKVTIAQGDTDTCAHVQVDALDAVGSGNAGHQSLGHWHDVLITQQVRQQNDEFVTAHAHDRVSGPNLLCHASRYLDQHLIAKVVPDRIIDGFESIQINAHYRQQPLSQTTEATIQNKLVFKRHTVKQAGQLVMAGVETQLALEMLLIADVTGNAKHTNDLAVDHDGQVRNVHGQQFFTLVSKPCLEALRGSGARCGKMLTDPHQVFLRHQTGKVMANELGCSLRLKLQACGIHTLDVAEQIEREHRVGVIGEQ